MSPVRSQQPGDLRVEHHVTKPVSIWETSSRPADPSPIVSIFDGIQWVDVHELLDDRRRLGRIRRSAEVLAADLRGALL